MIKIAFMPEWSNDSELFELMKRELFTAVVGDVMDTMGKLYQFLPPQIQPLREDMVVIGRAMPVLEADCHSEIISYNGKAQPFGLMFRALDDLKPGEVYICTGSSPEYALWGELMSTRAMQLGAVGAVVNGYSRDTRGILKLDFPTFSWGRYAQDQRVRGRVIDYRYPIQFPNKTIVQPGDLIFGDMDGVLVIPYQQETDIIQAAIEKVRGENRVREAIKSGMSATEAFEKFGIM